MEQRAIYSAAQCSRADVKERGTRTSPQTRDPKYPSGGPPLPPAPRFLVASHHDSHRPLPPTFVLKRHHRLYLLWAAIVTIIRCAKHLKFAAWRHLASNNAPDEGDEMQTTDRRLHARRYINDDNAPSDTLRRRRRRRKPETSINANWWIYTSL